MIITLKKIKNALRDEDIEGLIEYSGAPSDEYDDEAAEIHASITGINFIFLNEDKILKITISVWKESFNLEERDILKRLPSLRKAVLKIIS